MAFNIASILIVVGFISFILVVIASIKLILIKNIPGSWLIFVALIASIISTFLPEEEIENMTILATSIELAVHSLIMLMASFGFYRLVSFVAKNNANNSAQTDA